MKKSIFLLAFLSLVMISGAASTGFDSLQACKNIFSTNQNFGGLSSLIYLAFIAFSAMFMVAALAYALGYAFHIDRLTRFAKTEIGEILVTIIIVGIFIGFDVTTNLSTPSDFFALAKGAVSTNTYITDCTDLLTGSINLIPDLMAIFVARNFIFGSTITSFRLSIIINLFGASFMPFSGFGILAGPFFVLSEVTAVMITLMAGMVIVLEIIYYVFPVFFFLGVILRSIPWTRAAGGAFLGLFIAFYLALPLLLQGFISQAALDITQIESSEFSHTYNYGSFQPFSTQPGVQSAITSPLLLLNGIVSFAQSLYGIITEGIIPFTIQNVVEPLLYLMFGVIFSLIVTFDLMEMLGDLLGAPSLSSRHALKNII
ncbi:MAG: hypothetical protein ACP5RP_01405 [Candidatus Micrarchaeia archaeon]